MTPLTWPRRAVVAALIFVCAAPYVLITLTLNGQPTPRLFNGWLAVLTQDDPSSDQFRLDVQASQPGAPGAHPGLIYRVAACGPHDFSGELLMAGDARLSSTGGAAPIIFTSDTTSAALHRDQSVTIYDVTADNHLYFSAVDIVDIRFHDLPTCIGQMTPGSRPTAAFLGKGLEVAGNAREPIQHRWKIGPIVAPRTTSSWPLVGTMFGVAIDNFGEFQATGDLRGNYRIPTPFDAQIDSGPLTSLAQVEESRPAPVDESHMNWAAFTPLEPTARVANSGDISNWQAWQIVAAVLIGVAGSLLAAVTLDAMRARSHSSKQTAAAPVPAPTTSPPTSLVTVLFIASVLLLRRRSSHDRTGPCT